MGRVRVLPSGREFGSLREALSWAGAGMRLELDPGSYAESLEVDRDLEIVGGPGVVLRAGLALASPKVRLAGLEVREAEVLVRTGAGCILERCLLEGAPLRSENGSSTTLISSRLTGKVKLYGTVEVRETTLTGTLLVINGSALVEDSELLGGSSALAGWNADLTIRRCRVAGDPGAGPAQGALFLHLSRGHVEETRFEGGGVEVHGGRIFMRRCVVLDQRVGLRLDTLESNTLEHCELLRSREAGLQVGSGARLYLWGCRIAHAGEGLRAGVNGQALLTNCELADIEGAGLRSEGVVRARNCLLQGNGTGLVVAGHGRLEAHRCAFRDNGQDYAVEDSGELELEECDGEHALLPESERRPTESELIAMLAAGERGLAGRNLEWLNLRDVDLSGVDLERANLRDARFHRVDLSDARLRGADLRRVAISESVLARTDLEGADMRHGGLYDCSLENACLKGIDLSDGSLTPGRKPAPRELTRARLSRARLRGDFSQARFTEVEANLARLEECLLQGSDFARARLRKAALGGRSNLRQDMSGTNFEGADLSLADLSHRDLRGANFRGANLRSADLSHSDVSGAHFEGAQLGSVFWRSTTIEGASFSEDYAAHVREHLERVRAEEERQAATALQHQVDRRREAERLALATFGEEVRAHLERAGRVHGVSLVRDFGLPESLLEAAAALVEQELPIAARCSAALVGLEHFARSPDQPVPLPESDGWYRALYEFGRQFYPVEMEFEQDGESEFHSADAMRRYRLDLRPEGLEDWLRGYLFERSEAESGLDPEVRRQTLRDWLARLAPLLFAGDGPVPAYGLTDEDNENTEFGVYLLIGHRCAVVVRRHWHL